MHCLLRYPSIHDVIVTNRESTPEIVFVYRRDNKKCEAASLCGVIVIVVPGKTKCLLYFVGCTQNLIVDLIKMLLLLK